MSPFSAALRPGQTGARERSNRLQSSTFQRCGTSAGRVRYGPVASPVAGVAPVLRGQLLLTEKRDDDRPSNFDGSRPARGPGPYGKLRLVSLWDEAEQARRTERSAQQQRLAQQEQVWQQLVPMFEEFANAVRAKRVKHSYDNGILGKHTIVGDPWGLHLFVNKRGKWKFVRHFGLDSTRSPSSVVIGSSERGLQKPHELYGVTAEAWRAAFVNYMTSNRA